MAAPPLSLSHLSLALSGALSADASVRTPFEQALREWESSSGYMLALLSLYEAGVGRSERLLALLCLKAAVDRRWNERKEAAVGAEEKAGVRARLLAACDETESTLASQIVLIVANIARLEGLDAWPELLPALTAAAARSEPVEAARGLAALYRVIKLQAAKRLMAHRRAFFALAAQLHPPVAALRTAHCRAVFSTAASASGAEWLVTAGAPIQQCALLALKLERQLLLNGYAHLHTSPIAITALSDTLAAASAACATATALRRDGAVGSAHVLELALVAAKTLMEVQELQAIAFGGYLPAPDALDECSSGGLTARTLEGAIQLACNELARRPFTPGEADTSEKLLVRLLLLVRNACTCNAYAAAAQNVHQPHGRPPLPQASVCEAAVRAFMHSASLTDLVASLVARALPLHESELLEYNADPEAFVWEEASARETSSLRRCAEQTLKSLADGTSAREAVQSAVHTAANKAAAAVVAADEANVTAAVLQLDGAYTALAVVHGSRRASRPILSRVSRKTARTQRHARAAASIRGVGWRSVVLSGASEAPALVNVMRMLQQHCGAAPPQLAHLLRRRAAWLLGNFLSAPALCRGGATVNTRGAGGAKVDDITPWYMLLGQLLNDSHPGVTLTAAVALRRVVDSADAAPRAPPPIAPHTRDPLVPLARETLVPVLHLALSARELESRWRLTSLVQQLLEHSAPDETSCDSPTSMTSCTNCDGGTARLSDSPSEAEAAASRAAAIANWLPAAWSAADEQQLIREALLDVGASALRACGARLEGQVEGASAAHETLRRTCLEMVAVATSPPPGADAPPLGLVENALKLWRAAVATLGTTPHGKEEEFDCSPGRNAATGGGVVGEALMGLASRLQYILELGPEMARPVMQLVDWYLLQDTTTRCCDGKFIPAHAVMLSKMFEVSISEAREDRRGTLAAMSAMHTLLIVAPGHAHVLQPAITSGLKGLLNPDREGSDFSELALADLGGVAGRVLLTSPAVFDAALSAAAAAARSSDLPLVRFVNAWLNISDSILLSSARRLASLALASLLPLHSSALDTLDQILSFCVSVLAEDEQASARRTGRVGGGEHAYFAACIAPLDPLAPARLPLKSALQGCISRAAEVHKEDFRTAIARVDPAIMQQAQQALGL